jgi:uncharacterized protein (TIGR02421 family)
LKKKKVDVILQTPSKKLKEINEKVFKLGSSIQILKHLDWSKEVEQEFLSGWKSGKLKLPKIEYGLVDYGDQIRELEKLSQEFSGEHPLEIFTQKTIHGQIDAALMTQSLGTPRFQEYSEKIYGRPGRIIPGTDINNIQAAEELLRVSHQFEHPYIKETEVCLSAEQVKDFLEKKSTEIFANEGPRFEVSSDLVAKASATSKLVKLRAGTCFNSYDPEQLFAHEVMIHSLTGINGAAQPLLTTLGSGAPRTILTQEGLATFSEVIMGAVDLSRLRRLALRVLGIDRALKGADFVETFEFFLENGQTEKESFWSSSRIFRGGFPDQSIIFTKDGVYLDGLFKVYALFRWALTHDKIGLTHLLFCGKLTIEDLFLLESSYNEGLIAPPLFLPTWYQRIEGFAGTLSFLQMANSGVVKGLEDYYSHICESSVEQPLSEEL